ncbi:DUF397 domain-containing protein [Nocardia beijingensis]|uniref:DUF397 domain-containing protein n=1 Tax=Nocardia beijingensis TaxID=95162 RepID=UPI001892EACB|nr:DUF397 domain-containing protein [Nocardia beijingensis]MBF6464531.1 DUF397 domain-containing protein [Nocardia beijingensis]
MKTDLSGAEWFKSSHSESGGQCVEVAWLGDTHVGVRDSKNSTGPALIFTPSEWDAFTATITGGFDFAG